jgi:hypothetical protein
MKFVGGQTVWHCREEIQRRRFPLKILFVGEIHVGGAGGDGIKDLERADEAAVRIDRHLETAVGHSSDRLRESFRIGARSRQIPRLR